ncbi:hypothetical protein NHX12_022818 [Muraenolepis orangiensis]|uniref:C2H2-type domain-containing protein n=1 Tax=Muraenolepis orangiensis TaxID=630683 RepID=A0A9Q0EU69_9TELE|nr:hypothetical protein NHX12_022818 [Muraenolepis orangiensis]
MSSSMEEEEDGAAEEEVQFVSEALSRPVLDCIDIVSDSDEDEGDVVMEDKIARQKAAKVISTLDRLKHRVAAEKQERADKCKALKEMQRTQMAHGRQELAITASERTNYDAKQCVEMWLKMPGVRPGGVSAGRGRRIQTSFPSGSSSRHACPVINCGKVFDNVPLMEGHLKRFDHSPCDPTINLKGSPPELYACVACGRHFDTNAAWRRHLQSKLSSEDAGGHHVSQACQMITCFACPACYLLFNLRDLCLQHMASKNHFKQASAMIQDPKGRALPVPIPASAKSHLIDLCKDVDFNVRCSDCHKALTSHQEAQAHFNVYCRQGRAVSKAEKTVVEMMQRLLARGQCSLCCEVFLTQEELERHRESTQHAVEVNTTTEIALLQFCHFSEIQRACRAKEARKVRRSAGCGGPSASPHRKGDSEPAKRRKLCPSEKGEKGATMLQWVCECGLHFSEEAVAKKHLMAANQIFHLCGVCGKHMPDLSITRLHMCRFHGGAHLSNFLYSCQRCKVDMPRYEDILSHVVDAHNGHGYCVERQVPRERVADAVPSTSGACGQAPAERRRTAPTPARAPKPDPTWMCRMCEETFVSEADVQKHCGDVANHSFQRFVCGHCPQKFFKESTLRRHCLSEHAGLVAVAYFCGLCDSMQFDSQEEFTEHYERQHSRDYYRVDEHEGDRPAPDDATSGELDADESVPTKGGPAVERCPCMGSEKCEGERKALYTRCVKRLSAEGQCEYVCSPCSVSVSTYAQIKTHVHSMHAALALPNTFDVVCKACLESFGFEDAKLAKVLSMDVGSEDGEAKEGALDEDMEQELAFGATQTRESSDLEEALERSRLDF